jgi:adenylyltransferase/sulfurtransferase
VGLEGQERLSAGSVLLVGAGGLGAPAGLYLAAAGVGRIGLVDFDVVDATNLQRQVTYDVRDVGRPKLEAARERLLGLNPHIEVTSHATRLSSDNALDIIGAYDIVIDGTDNFPTRYLVNDACVLLGKPNVYGSVFRFEGQASVFALDDGPCYRCLYPEPPPPGMVPDCAEGGVLGVLPGIIGSIQANEAIKLIIGRGESLSGRLLLFDALEMRFRELRLEKDPRCPVCGENPTMTALVDYEDFCGVRQERETIELVPEILPRDLKARLDNGENILVVDVREPHEHSLCNIGGTLIPMGEIPARVDEIDPGREVVVYCRTGRRSAQVVSWLLRSGYEKVWNLSGGIHRWADEVDPSIPKY